MKKSTTLLNELEAHKNNKKDRRKFGLVLQGGGMRGTYSGAATLPLVEYGFSQTFDHVIGASAGAINAAYFINGYPHIQDAYAEDLSNKNFVNLLRKEKKVDVDFAVDSVMKNGRPLNLDKLRASSTKLHIVLTDARTGRKKVISDHETFIAIYEELRATSALPILYDKKVLVQGRYYVDGGVADTLPIDVALKLGCTDVVVVMTTQFSKHKFDKRHERLRNHLIKRFAKSQSKAIRNILPSNEKVLRTNLRRLKHPTKKTKFYVLEPSNEEFLISLGTIDKPKVREFAELGIRDMDAFLHREIFI